MTTDIKPADNTAMVDDEMIEKFLSVNNPDIDKKTKVTFLQIAKSLNLNPFNREIYLIGYGNKASIVTGYQVYLRKATETGNLDGWNTEIIRTSDGKNIAGVKITIHRKDRAHPFEKTVLFQEFKKNSGIWREKPVYMIEKVAISVGMRLAFPEVLGTMPYSQEEMDGASDTNYQHVTPDQVVDAEKPKAATKTKTTKKTSKKKTTGDTATPDQATTNDPIKKYKADVKNDISNLMSHMAKLSKVSISDVATVVTAYVKKHYNKASTDMTLDELNELKDILTAHKGRPLDELQ